MKNLISCLLALISGWMLPLTGADEAPANMLANPSFADGLAGWEVSAPPDVFTLEATPDGPALRYWLKEGSKKANPYVAQPVKIERCYYRLSLRYRTDGRVAPTVLTYIVGREGKPPGPNRIIRLQSPKEWTDFSVDFLGGSTDQLGDMELRLYPGTTDPLRMSDVYEAGSFVPDGGHSGAAEFTAIRLEKLSRETPGAPPGPYAVKSEEFDVGTVDDFPLRAGVELSQGLAGPKPPVIVWIFGGGWVHGDINSLKGWSKYFATRGYPGVRIQYRWLSQGGNVDTVMDDLRAGVAWVKAHADEFGWDADRIIFAGSSAGGHLAALVGEQTPECVGIIGFPGMYDIVEKYDGNFGRSSTWLKGTARENWEQGSATYNMRNPSPDALLVHGSLDPAIDARQAVDFAEVVNTHGGHGEAMIIPEMDHSVALTPEVAEKMEAFIRASSGQENP